MFALIASLSAPTAAPSNLSPRGVKRSRSPDQYGDAGFDDGDHEDSTCFSYLLMFLRRFLHSIRTFGKHVRDSEASKEEAKFGSNV